MRTTSLILAAATLGAASLLPAHAKGTVQVNYLQPENFWDIGLGSVERERNLKVLTVHLQELAGRLPDGQTLKLEVSNVDMAGRMTPTHRGGDVRVLTGRADWPRINLHYTLEAGGTELKSGDAKIADLNYLTNFRSAQLQRTELGYEKRMLDTWFDKTFATSPR